jgi:DNA-binding response OmpR family regulator
VDASGPFTAPTILVVDEMDALRKLLQTILTRAGYQVLQADSGEAALRLVAEYPGRIDLLVCHWLMPGMDGPTTVQRVRTLSSGVKVILMSASDPDVPLPPECTFVLRPFGVDTLLRTVSELVTRMPETAKSADPTE